VRATAPGVPAAPKPPGPSVQPESSNEVDVQSPWGSSVVYRQTTGASSDVGTSVVIVRGVGNGAHSSGAGPDGAFRAQLIHASRSQRARMNTPPITGRAYIPACFPLSVQ